MGGAICYKIASKTAASRSGKVAWELGAQSTRLRGGFNGVGLQSELCIAPIVAVKSPEYAVRKIAHQPRVSRRLLFARDRHLCAYCGNVYAHDDLSMDHIQPASRGGRDVWSNLVAACKTCNQIKADRTPEEARMPLLYVPYAPNRFEDIIVRGRRVIADQMAFLLGGVPRHSRLLG